MRYAGLEKLLGEKLHELQDTSAKLHAAGSEVVRDKGELSCLT